MTQHFRRLAFFLIPSLLSACASLSGVQERFAVCSYDHVWEAALDAAKSRSITREDKDAGVIETGWLEIPMRGRTFGALQRDLGDNKDRSRISLTVKRLADVTKISVSEDRQRWAFRGGSRLFGWTDTDPSADVLNEMQRRLDAKLKERGCSLT